MDTGGATKRRTGSVVTRAGKGFVTRLPAEAADTLIVDTVFLVVSCVVARETEWFKGCGIAEGNVVEFLEEGESIEAVEGVYKIGFLFIDDGIGGCNIFEATICLVGSV